MKKTIQKLTLKSETVKTLSGAHLTRVHGGATEPWTNPNSNYCSMAEDSCQTLHVTECAGLCTTNPWTARCVPV